MKLGVPGLTRYMYVSIYLFASEPNKLVWMTLMLFPQIIVTLGA